MKGRDESASRSEGEGKKSEGLTRSFLIASWERLFQKFDSGQFEIIRESIYSDDTQMINFEREI
jgi:hypothetical protein